MTKGRASVTALLLSALAGCASSTGPDGAAGRAASLWAARTPYLGDSSRVAALVTEVGPAPAGSYSLELHTATPPFGLTVHLQRLDKPASTDFREPATLLLGLIGNVDQVTFASGSDAYSLTAAVVSEDVGFEVKRLGQDQRLLADHVAKTAD